MKLKKILLCALCSTSLTVFVNAKPANAIICELWDLLNVLVTPLPTVDYSTDITALFVQLEQILQTIEAFNEVTEYKNNLC